MKKRILLIEDDPDILAIVSTVLTEEDFEVTGIAGTNDIISTVEGCKPNIVITDFFMPGFLPGGQICMWIKQNKHLAHLPVILMSAYPKSVIGVGKFPYDAYLKKPFDIDHLIKVVKNLLLQTGDIEDTSGMRPKLTT